jgi:signal peptidase II
VVAAIGILVWLFWLGAAHDWLLTVALGSVMGGIGGNLFDRLGLWQNPENPGQWRTEVRDWILFRYEQYTWPNFNIADSLLVCGAILLVCTDSSTNRSHLQKPRNSGFLLGPID